MTLLDVERAVRDLCFAAEPSDVLLSQLGDRRVWLLYREMVRDRLRREIRIALPRSSRALGEDTLERAFVRYLDEQPPRTRFFREVVSAFVASALPALRDDASLPAFIVDLVQYELAVWEVADLDADALGPVVEFAFDRKPALSGALRLLRVHHAVHKAPQPDATYASGELRLAVHRARDDQRPRTWVLDAATFALLQLWQAGELSVSDALQRVAKEQSFALDAVFVDRLCSTLAGFMDAGLVLGSR